jgi:hypothetical protein
LRFLFDELKTGHIKIWIDFQTVILFFNVLLCP